MEFVRIVFIWNIDNKIYKRTFRKIVDEKNSIKFY